MNTGVIIAIGVGAGLLSIYGLVEQKLNQKRCSQCGFRMSRENPDGACPRCKEKTQAGAPPKRFLRVWPTLTLIALPLCVMIVDAAVLLKEGSESSSEVAIRVVKESASRKENFTVQQYLYATVYHRRDAGEDVRIAGWGAEEPASGSKRVVVTFAYSEGGVSNVAVWDVDLDRRKVAPTNDAARELSWD